MDIPLILDKLYPAAAWRGSAATYADLVWEDSVIPKPSEQTLIDAWGTIELDQAREIKIAEWAALCRADIVNGFSSTALGTTYYYDSAKEDQLNLIGAVSTTSDMNYACRTTADSKKIYILHTHTQLLQVLNDGKNIKLQILEKFNTLKTEAMAATSISSLDLLVW